MLTQLIAPLSFEDFYKNHVHQKVPFAVSAKFNFSGAEWDAWNILSAILPHHSDCWLPEKGALPSCPMLNQGKVHIRVAKAAFQKGRTILVRHAEEAHPWIKILSCEFRELFRKTTDTQIYFTPKNTEGFDWHYDAEEVFVIQVRGSKEFYLRTNTINPHPVYRKLPKDLEFERETSFPMMACLLQQGDGLYIPKGYWHKARAIEDSLHLSIGVV